MTEIQAMTLSLLLFIAYRIVNPSNKRDMEALKCYRECLEEICEAEGLWTHGEAD